MVNLIKFEFHKLFRMKSFYICTAVMLFMVAATLVTIKIGMPENPYYSGVMCMLTSANNGMFVLVSAIFVALFVCGDIEQHTIKNIYGRGFSRNAVYFSKLIVGLIAVLIEFVAVLLFALALGSCLFGNKNLPDGNYAAIIAAQFAGYLSYAASIFFIAVLCKRLAAAIPLAVVTHSVIGLVLLLLDVLLLDKVDFALQDYWYDGFLGELSSLDIADSRIAVCVALSAGYAVIFIVAGMFIGRKREV